MQLSGLTQTVLIGLAGSLGAISRYLISLFFVKRIPSRIPFGTLIINLTGSFLIGFLIALASHKILNPALQVILTTGFLGGYTTFSTMSWEGVQLARGGYTLQSVSYLLGSLIAGLLAAYAGIFLGGGLH